MRETQVLGRVYTISSRRGGCFYLRLLLHNVKGPGVRETQVLGRVYMISSHQGECFYFRLLLHNVKGPQSFADLRIVNGESYNSPVSQRNVVVYNCNCATSGVL